jgi:hypothetical protein
LLKGFLALGSKKHKRQIAGNAIEMAQIQRQASDIPLAKLQRGKIRSLYRAGSNQLSVIHIDSYDPAVWTNSMSKIKGGNPVPAGHIQYGCTFIKIQVSHKAFCKGPRPGIFFR